MRDFFQVVIKMCLTYNVNPFHFAQYKENVFTPTKIVA